MAMSASGMKSAIRSALSAEFGSELEQINDDTDLSAYTREQYEERYWSAVASGIVSYITGNAQATGLDSGGDSHDLSIS